MIKLGNSTLGYTDNMKALTRSRIEKILSAENRYRDGDMAYTASRKDFIVNLLEQGYKLEISDYPKKNTYRIATKIENVSSGWNITKIEYNFAEYILNNKILENIVEILKNEALKEEQEAKRIKFEEDKKTKEKELIDRQDAEYKAWIDTEIKEYNNVENITIAENIFLTEMKISYTYMIKRLLVLIENIDNQKCKNELKSMLHSNNTSSKKVFFHITGIKLPSTNKGTHEILNNLNKNDYQGIIDYKLKLQENEEIYSTLTGSPGNKKYNKVVGIEINAKLFFNIACRSGEISVTHIKTGCKLTSGDNKDETIIKAMEMIEDPQIQIRTKELLSEYGEAPQIISEYIEQYGNLIVI